MQYSPKLKRIRDEIQAILQREDVAGLVYLHEPGFTEFINYVTPSYSCMEVEKDVLRVRTKGKYETTEEKTKAIADTANMLKMLSEVAVFSLAPMLQLSERLDKETGAEHGKSRFHTDSDDKN